ncbi:MAG: hypothetical protein H8E36_02420 [Rhodospirillaceae bacterium]|nr:hypothetical protein [Rhodospirillaceae bacterium]MBL6930465.1 hypothetical protein [Rhodospirillales bacterium]MBL6942223.1 hypothetical protein [Rhodospirillales bacterium]
MSATKTLSGFYALVVLLVAGIILSGCQRPPYNREDNFAVTSELFSADDFEHTRVRDGTGKMEVLHAATSNREVSVLFVETHQAAVINDPAIFPRLIMKGWKALQGKEIKFGIKSRAVTPGGKVDFERFSFLANSCFAFHSIYQPSGSDTLSRYTKLIAGYYCHSIAAPLSDAAVARFLSSITVPKFNSVELPGELSSNVYYEPVQALKTRSVHTKRN